MKNYLKLVNFEFNRFAKLFAILVGITFLIQIAGIIVLSNKYVSIANEKIYEEMMTKAQFIEEYGQMSFSRFTYSAWFFGPIALCIAGVAFYIFLIWYRDWFGKNTFIYRLLMLPTTRLNIFYAKLTNILLLTFGFVAFQLLFLPIETTVFKWIVPSEFRIDMEIIKILNSTKELSIIFPSSFTEFILYYGTGIMAVSVIFTAILLERSFKWKGIFAGILFGAIAVGILISPVVLQEFVLNDFLYPLELFLLEVVMGLFILAGSIWTSGFLLKKKITV